MKALRIWSFAFVMLAFDRRRLWTKRPHLPRRSLRQPVRLERPLADALSSGDAQVEVDGRYFEYLFGLLH